MTLEVEMPHPDMPGMKRKGRVYVCDLAGTEPAGDIVYALYEKKVGVTGFGRWRLNECRAEGGESKLRGFWVLSDVDRQHSSQFFGGEFCTYDHGKKGTLRN